MESEASQRGGFGAGRYSHCPGRGKLCASDNTKSGKQKNCHDEVDQWDSLSVARAITTAPGVIGVKAETSGVLAVRIWRGLAWAGVRHGEELRTAS